MTSARDLAKAVKAIRPNTLPSVPFTPTGRPSGTVQSVLDVALPIADIRSFGAKTDPSFDNTSAIMAAVTYLNSLGGGIIDVPAGIFRVALQGAFDGSSSGLNTHALQIPYDNITFRGQGRGVTQLRPLVDNAGYGVLRWVKKPLENGVVKISGGGVCDLTISGAFTLTVATSAASPLSISGIRDFDILRVGVKDSAGYGIALQNGGRKGLRIHDVVIDGTLQDGIDVKDNGSIDDDCWISMVTIKNWGRSTSDEDFQDDPLAGLDLLGIGWNVNGVRIYMNDGGGFCSAGLRLKQGLDTGLGPRGNAPKYTVINNVQIIRELQTTGISSMGMHIKAPLVVLGDNFSIRGDFDRGIRIEQPYGHIGSGVIDLTAGLVGIEVNAKSSATDQDLTGAYNCHVASPMIRNCAIGIDVNQPDLAMDSPRLVNCAIGIDLTAVAATGASGTPRFENCGSNFAQTGDKGANILVAGDSAPVYAAPIADNNHLANQAFAIWQRATSFANPNNNAFVADACFVQHDLTHTSTISRIDTPDLQSVPGGRYRLNWLFTSVSAGSRAGILRRLYGLERYLGRWITIRSLVKLNRDGNVLISVSYNTGTGGGSIPGAANPVNIPVLANTDTWVERKVLVGTTTTIGTDSSLVVETRLVSPATGDVLQVGAQSITIGRGSSSLMPRSDAEELAICQRRYASFAIQSENGSRSIRFPVPMRRIPTVTVSAGTASNITAEGFELAHTSAVTVTVTAAAD